jgi:hypothetical protein
MKTTASLITRVAAATGVALGAFALAAIAATWSAPTQAPPLGNTDAPLNVSAVDQVKTGDLALGGLLITSSNFQFYPGTPITVGQVLKALDSNGTIGWGDLPSSGNLTWVSDTIFASNKQTTEKVTSYTALSHICMITGLNNGGCDTGTNFTLAPVGMGGFWKATVTAVGDCNAQVTMTYMCAKIR